MPVFNQTDSGYVYSFSSSFKCAYDAQLAIKINEPVGKAEYEKRMLKYKAKLTVMLFVHRSDAWSIKFHCVLQSLYWANIAKRYFVKFLQYTVYVILYCVGSNIKGLI